VGRLSHGCKRSNFIVKTRSGEPRHLEAFLKVPGRDRLPGDMLHIQLASLLPDAPDVGAAPLELWPPSTSPAPHFFKAMDATRNGHRSLCQLWVKLHNSVPYKTELSSLASSCCCYVHCVTLGGDLGGRGGGGSIWVMSQTSFH
jgi:hypothetical protein